MNGISAVSIFLLKRQRHLNSLEIELTRRTSIKDFIEALGIPHPEIYRLEVNGREVAFEYIPGEDQVEVFPFPPGVDLAINTILRSPLREISFLVDANVAKLANLLRMVGFDTSYDPELDDRKLAEKANAEERILLTRDRALLKRKVVIHGRMIRNNDPLSQLRETLDLYGIRDKLKPFSRCIYCNSLLQPVKKEDIIDRLEPLTRKYFNDFNICRDCNRVYWPGSHHDSMTNLIKGL